MSMELVMLIILIMIGICLIEYFLVQLNDKLGLIPPVLSVVSIVYLEFSGVVLTVIIFLIYFAVSFGDKRKNKKLSMIEKMIIDDLD